MGVSVTGNGIASPTLSPRGEGVWRACLAFLLLLIVGGSAQAQTFPKFTGFVVDAANVIPPDRAAALAARLDALQRDTGRQLVVATIPDLQGYPIEDYGYKLGRAWNVGLKGLNNGAILIVAPNERKVRIEIGYGLEGTVTDALSSVIVTQTILPAFRAGDIPGGITAGADALIAQLRLPDDQAKAKLAEAVAQHDKSTRGTQRGSGFPLPLAFWGIVIAFILLSMIRGGGGGGGGRRYRRDGGSALPIILWGLGNAIGGGRGGGGGGFGGSGGGGGGWMGGGFGGGGGGSFGGGGASAPAAAAEAGTSGEIVPVVAQSSDDYGDVALVWSIAAAFLALAAIAAFPDFFVGLLDRLRGDWSHEYSRRTLLTILLVVLTVKFAVARLLLEWRPLRLALTPRAVKAGRVRARAIGLFRVGAEKRTAGATGVLLYLSIAEHRAEIVTDEAMLSRTPPEIWGAAMAELIAAVRDGRPGDGIAAAIGRIGTVLGEHFPRAADDRNELPDRLIQL